MDILYSCDLRQGHGREGCSEEGSRAKGATWHSGCCLTMAVYPWFTKVESMGSFKAKCMKVGLKRTHSAHISMILILILSAVPSVPDQSGDYFGEKALLREELGYSDHPMLQAASSCIIPLHHFSGKRGEEPRTATIKADTMLSTLKITQKVWAFGPLSEVTWGDMSGRFQM